MPINKVSQISTKTGDTGTSKNFVNETFEKDDILFEILGSMDTLSSFIGLSYHYHELDFLKIIQTELQTINALIATNPKHVLYQKIQKVSCEDIELLENNMQALLTEHPIEPHFYLPGSETSLGGAYLDVSRSICRKTERTLVHFIKTANREDLSDALKYLNRLSDYLFVLVRSLS